MYGNDPDLHAAMKILCSEYLVGLLCKNFIPMTVLVVRPAGGFFLADHS